MLISLQADKDFHKNLSTSQRVNLFYLPADLPAFFRTTSPAKRTPFPL